MGFELSLKNLLMQENFVPESFFKEIIKVKSTKIESPSFDMPLLRFSYDELTRNPDANSEIKLFLRPLLVVINFLAAERLTHFFINQRTQPLLDGLRKEAKNTIKTIGSRTRASLQHALEHHKGMDLEVKIDAPIILIPENPADLTKSIFVVDFGKISVGSQLVSTLDKRKGRLIDCNATLGSESSFHDMLYEKIKIELSEFGVYFADAVSKWWELEQDYSKIGAANKIIDEIDVNLIVETCIVSNAANLARTKFNAVLPEISVFLSNLKTAKLMFILDQLSTSLPPSATPTSPPRTTLSVPLEINTLKRPIPNVEKIVEHAKNSDSSEDDEFFDAYEDVHILREGMGNLSISEPLNFFGEFMIEKVLLQIEKTSFGGDDQPVISLRASRLGLEVSGWEGRTALCFSLNEFEVREHISGSCGALIMQGECLKSGDELLSITVDLLDPRNREFLGVETSICISLSCLRLGIEPAFISKLADFFLQEFVPIIESNSGKHALHPLQVVETQIIEAYFPKTSVAFCFGQLSIELFDRSTIRSKLTAGPINLNVRISGQEFDTSGSISALDLIGYGALGEKGDYCKILYFEGSCVAEFSFKTPFLSPGVLPNSSLLKLSAGAMKIVYEPAHLKFLFETFGTLSRAFLPAAPLQDENLCKTLDLKSKPLVTAAYLDFDLQSPVIYVPSARAKGGCLCLFLGRLLVKNQFSVVQDFLLDQVLMITLKDTHISFKETVGSLGERMILNKFVLPVSIRLTGDALARNFAEMEIDSAVDEMIVEMSEDDYQRFLLIASEATFSLSQIANSHPESLNSDQGAKVAEARPAALATVEKFLFDAKANIASVKLKLKSENDHIKLESEILRIEISATSHTTRGMVVEASMQGMRACDMEDTQQEFRDFVSVGTVIESGGLEEAESDQASKTELLGGTEPVQTKKYFLIRVDQDVHGAMIFNLYLESPRICILFDTIFYLQKFFTSTPQDSSLMTAEIEHRATHESGSPKNQPFSMMFNINDASVVLFEDVKRAGCEAMALRLGAISVTMGKDLSVIVVDLSSFIYNTGAPIDSRITVIENLSTNLTLTTDLGLGRADLEAFVQPLVITLSFKDLQLLQSFSCAMSDAQSRYAQEPTLPIAELAESWPTSVATAGSELCKKNCEKV